MAAATRLTGETVAAVPPRANAVALAPRRHVGTDGIDPADHLVARDPRITHAREGSLNDEGVAVADTTGLDVDAYFRRSRVRDLALDDFEVGTRLGDNRRLHRLCHGLAKEATVQKRRDPCRTRACSVAREHSL